MTQRVLPSTTGASSWSTGKYFAECCALLSKPNKECCVQVSSYESLVMAADQNLAKNSAHAGLRTLDPLLGPHRHEQKCFAAHVCKVSFNNLP